MNANNRTIAFQVPEELFGRLKDCLLYTSPNSGEQDFTGRVLILSPDTLRESYWQPENQLWLALSGFGCRPYARGRSVLCTCLGDGETTRWNRSEFVEMCIRDSTSLISPAPINFAIAAINPSASSMPGRMNAG